MKTFYSNDHDSFWPVGCTSVVVAENEAEARKLLDAALKEHSSVPEIGYQLIEVPPNTAKVIVDGNY